MASPKTVVRASEPSACAPATPYASRRANGLSSRVFQGVELEHEPPMNDDVASGRPHPEVLTTNRAADHQVFIGQG